MCIRDSIGCTDREPSYPEPRDSEPGDFGVFYGYGKGGPDTAVPVRGSVAGC